MAYRTKNDNQVEHLQPPQSLDTERAVLGAILKDNEALGFVLEVFEDGSHFYNDKHRLIFEAAIALYNRSEPCDITTVAEELVKQGHLERIGNRTYLVELAESVASTANVETHARIILDKSVLRRLINTSNTIARSCYTLDEPVEALLDMAETNIFDISEVRLKKGFLQLNDVVKPALKHIEDISAGEGAVGVNTGFPELDKLTLGLHQSELIIIAGRPSMGKTALAMNIAEYVAIDLDMTVGMFSIEMSAEQLVMRLLCGRAGIDQQKVRSGKLNSAEWQALVKAGEQFRETKMFLDDSPTLSPLEMRAKARRLKKTHDVDLIVVDYLQLMHGSGRQENRQQEMSMISRSMKALAKELAIPVIGISQLSRQVESRTGDKTPQLSDLRESGAIEQDADVVMFVHRPEYYMSEDEKAAESAKPDWETKLGKANIIVAKQRNGPTGRIELAFVGRLAKFGNLDKAHAEVPPGVEPIGNDADSPF